MRSLFSSSLLEDVLKKSFGLQQFRPKQAQVIDHILNGEHTLALLPTGYGKSLCYQVPSQVLPGITLVVSPLIALMHDQVNGLLRRGITNVTLLNSSMESEERDDRMAAIRAGAYKLLYVAPERFESPRFKQLLASIDVSLLVIDEAHCISQWGHDFRPNYRNLSEHLSHIPGATVLAVTATATPAVQDDIIRTLNLSSIEKVVGNFDRPNLRFNVVACRNNYEKDELLFAMLRSERAPSIIYTSSRKETEALASRLLSHGIATAYYHAGMLADARAKAQRAFECDEVDAIVCTVAFGMGVDKPNVRRVIHYNLPGSLESYYQEAGRAGRDGNPAVCTLLFQSKDIYTQRWLLDKNYPDPETVDDIFLYLKRRAPQPVRRFEIADNVAAEDGAINATLDLLRSLELVSPVGNGAVAVSDRGSECVRVPVAKLFERKQRDSARLQRMINYAQSEDCRRRAIVEYFGQRLEGTNCGACDVCVNGSAARPQFAPAVEFTPRARAFRLPAGGASMDFSKHKPEEIEQAILALISELEGTVGRTTIAQILVGSKSKKLAEKGLVQSHYYAKFAGHGEAKILSEIDGAIARGEVIVSRGLYPKVSLTKAGNARVSHG